MPIFRAREEVNVALYCIQKGNLTDVLNETLRKVRAKRKCITKMKSTTNCRKELNLPEDILCDV
jgi:hypothetical protein